MQLGSFLVSDVVMCSPRSIVPWADRIEENWWSLEKQFLHTFLRSERDLEIPHRSWQTDGNLACGWERATSQTSTLSERTMESCVREVYDDSQRTAGQKRTSSQSSRPHRNRGRRQPMIQQIPEQYQKYMNTRTRMKKRTTRMVRTKNRWTSQTTRIMTWRERRFRSPTQLRRRASSLGEKRTETQENVFVKKTADDEVTKATDHTCPTT